MERIEHKRQTLFTSCHADDDGMDIDADDSNDYDGSCYCCCCCCFIQNIVIFSVVLRKYFNNN